MYLYGASGHAKVILEILAATGIEIEGLIDDDPSIMDLCGYEVKHNLDSFQSTYIISIGNNQTRKIIANKFHVQYGIAIHPSAIISPSAIIGEGTVVMPGVIINAGAVIGKHCIINTGASVDHECVVGDYVHIAPHSSLCGGVMVGEGSLIGVGSSIIPCIHIGNWCRIGAGAAVIENIPDNCTAVGVPAKAIKFHEQL